MCDFSACAPHFAAWSSSVYVTSLAENAWGRRTGSARARQQWRHDLRGVPTQVRGTSRGAHDAQWRCCQRWVTQCSTIGWMTYRVAISHFAFSLVLPRCFFSHAVNIDRSYFNFILPFRVVSLYRGKVTTGSVSSTTACLEFSMLLKMQTNWQCTSFNITRWSRH